MIRRAATLRHAVLAVPALLGVTGALSACGSTAAHRSPAASSAIASSAIATTPTTGTQAAVAEAERTHEYPGSPPRQTVLGGWRSAVQAVEVFATTYINWTAASVSGRLRALSEVSVGQARSAMSLAASDTRRDYELRRAGIANSGIVEAIAPLRGRPGRYAVVTRELTTATNTAAYRGLAPAWHVSVATVAQVQGGLWVLSAWQPEN